MKTEKAVSLNKKAPLKKQGIGPQELENFKKA
jgi:hypothetical protein